MKTTNTKNSSLSVYQKIFSKQNTKFRYVVIAVCLLIYIGIVIADFTTQNRNTDIYTASPVRTVLVLIMTLMLCKAGYVISVILLAARAVYASIMIVNGSHNANIPLLLSVICTAVGITVLYFVLNRINEIIMPILDENAQNQVLKEEVIEAAERALESEKIINENEKELTRLAYFDQLTMLPNRTKIKVEMNTLIESQISFSVIFIGLDGFKTINESKGHDLGDEILTETAHRIDALKEAMDISGRLGGDEFVIVSTSHSEDGDCEDYIRRLNKAFEKPFANSSGAGIYVSSSFGLASFPRDGSTVSELLKNADIALNKAKNDGKNRYVLFNHNMQVEIDYHNHISMLMRSAMENDEFYLVYQPQFYPNKKLRGFEALVRWNSPELGNVSPVAFIPVAEETGLILTLGRKILKSACKKLKEISEIYGGDIIMSVNISSRQFAEKDFVRTVNSALIESGAKSDQLELEITESLLLSSVEETSETLSQLKRMSIKVSIDDFGTGYSSLSYLRTLPVDTLKIDKSFIDVISGDENGKNIVNTIITLAHTLKMTVIAEGVEYDEQLDYLKSQSCDCIQGFLFSKPLSSADVSELVRHYGENK